MHTRKKLGILLVIFTLLSLLIALGVYTGGRALGNYLIDNVFYSQSDILEQEKALFDEFISYCNEAQITLTSRDEINLWLEGRQNLIIAVYNGGQPLGNAESGVLLYGLGSDIGTTYELLSGEYQDYWYTCAVMTRGDFMRSKTVRIMYYPMYGARKYALYIPASCAFIAFAAALMLFIRGKTRYISYLCRELMRMEGGELGVPLRLKGSDELTTLAENMEHMRLSFIERLKHEEEMSSNSRELLTAMSHDLRTPLTALMGYLEILHSGRLEEKYIDSALKRAVQLKQMTDELFEYFLVYSTGDDKLETEEYDALTVLGQLWDEGFLSLDEAGFTSTVEFGSTGGAININLRFMRRVFDNIISNIKKYADMSEPIQVRFLVENGLCSTTVTNKIGDVDKAESSGIGLQSCKKILSAHLGEFATREEGGYFTSVIKLPVRM